MTSKEFWSGVGAFAAIAAAGTVAVLGAEQQKKEAVELQARLNRAAFKFNQEAFSKTGFTLEVDQINPGSVSKDYNGVFNTVSGPVRIYMKKQPGQMVFTSPSRDLVKQNFLEFALKDGLKISAEAIDIV